MNTTTRRAFLRTFAGASCAAVMLRHFVGSAQEGAYPLRFLFVYTNDGRDLRSRCTGTGRQFTLGPSYSELEPIRDKLLVLDGLRIPEHVDEEHPNGRCAMLTGRPATTQWRSRGISIDRLLARSLSHGESLYTGTQSPDEGLDVPISWHGAGLMNDAFVGGEQALMRHLFPGIAVPTEGDEGQTDGTLENELALHRFLMEDVRRLEKVAPAEEREKVMLHLEALMQLEASLMGSGGTGHPLPSCDGEVLRSASTETDRISQIVAHALACGRARIAVLRIGVNEPHHEYSHWNDQSTLDRLVALDRTYNAHFVKLIGALESFREGDGTLLDHTIVVWSSEVSGDHGNELHGTEGMPFILAGGRSAKLRLGERIVALGKTNTELYRAIALKLGVTDTSDFGDPARPSPLAEIFGT